MSGLRVGFIGLGSQGGGMARRIVEDGYPLTIWARRPETLEPFADTAATPVATPADVGRASDIVGVCVVTDVDVDDVVRGPDGLLAGMAAGGVIAIHSTIHPDTCRRLATAAAEHGVTLIDAPVSGGGQAATERRLLVMVGGPADVVARCRPVFETYGNPVIRMGDVGAGEVAKVLNNLVFTAQVGLALDTYALAADLGVEREAAAAVLAHGSAGSRAAAIMAASSFDIAGVRGAAPLLRKDVAIALDLARRAGAAPTTVLADVAHATLELLEGTA